eukprot:CAMPEP_0204597282 /NCGR_PEP_ID=MMETSP0661-20131031/53719_1 /ASSEMBLY_ACC=CAM_ASM_000606 /TAXON_ID=109239 /ORGANISM="Alexandrium margalefi, Strain AMGDE01CS-322" /LENGTH=171 /DNA_ID=CAMNT_0051607963 /DNA_START=216 /DNA_END=728 /DNA_ORIENTATION=-
MKLKLSFSWGEAAEVRSRASGSGTGLPAPVHCFIFLMTTQQQRKLNRRRYECCFDFESGADHAGFALSKSPGPKTCPAESNPPQDGRRSVHDGDNAVREDSDGSGGVNHSAHGMQSPRWAAAPSAVHRQGQQRRQDPDKDGDDERSGERHAPPEVVQQHAEHGARGAQSEH